MPSNDYYNHSSWPATGAAGRSADARAEMDAIAVGFAKLAPLVGNAFKIAYVNAGATAWDVLGGTGLVKLRAAAVPVIAADGTDYLSPAGAAVVTNKTIVVANNTITTAAHGTLAATELNAALAELADDDAFIAAALAAHLADGTDAHDASAISSIPDGNLAATDVQAALNELDSEKVAKAGDTMTGDLHLASNLDFTGTNRRITADFSNATQSNRTLFQSSTVNGFTDIQALPNGTATTAAYSVLNSAGAVNASVGQLVVDSLSVSLRSAITGSGTVLPMEFLMDGVKRMAIPTSGDGIRVFGTAEGGEIGFANTSGTISAQVDYVTAGTKLRLVNNGVEVLTARADGAATANTIMWPIGGFSTSTDSVQLAGGSGARAMSLVADGTQLAFYRAGAAVGSITVAGATTAYNTSSDYRLKADVADLQGSGDFIDALRPRSYTWLIDGKRGVGFIAHELQAVSPGSVTGTKDALTEDGAPAYQAVEYGSPEMITYMVAELQALRKRVAELEAKQLAVK